MMKCTFEKSKIKKATGAQLQEKQETVPQDFLSKDWSSLPGPDRKLCPGNSLKRFLWELPLAYNGNGESSSPSFLKDYDFRPFSR
jgi:hypothetical protein